MLNHCFRSIKLLFRSSPALVLLVIGVTAIGMAACITVFSVFYGVLLNPLPYPSGARLATVQEVSMGSASTVSPANFLDFQARATAFSLMAAHTSSAGILSTDTGAQKLINTSATPELFAVLGLQPQLGRDFRPEDSLPSAAKTAILTERTWRDRFRSDPDILGKSITLDAAPAIVIGVLPAGADFPISGSDLFTPFIFPDNPEAQRGAHYLDVIAQLASGRTVEEANAQIASIARQLSRLHPATNANSSAMALPYAETITGEVRPILLLLMGAVLFLLLIVCANIASLLLARSVAKEREMAVRTALGATRLQLIASSMGEALALSLSSCVLALYASDLMLGIVIHSAASEIPRITSARINVPAALFALAVALLVGMFFGFAPAIRLSRVSLGNLRTASATARSSRSARSLRHVLVIGELTLSIVLLAGAGLLIRSLIHLNSVDPGFSPDSSLVFNVSLPASRYDSSEEINAFYSQLGTRLRALPGSEGVAMTFILPLTADRFRSSFAIRGAPSIVAADEPSAALNVISEGYTDTLRIPILKGRGFQSTDTLTSARVVVVNESAAKQFFAEGNPIGKVVDFGASMGYERLSGEIVGVIGDTRAYGLDRPAPPTFYTPVSQTGTSSLWVILRSSVPPQTLISSARQVVNSIDPMAAIADTESLKQVYDRWFARRRLTTNLLLAFGAVGLLVASFGIFGVISYAVSQRTQEIGIRVALGATYSRIIGAFMREAAALIAIAIALGLTFEALLARLLRDLLVGVNTTDRLTLFSVSVLVAGTGFVASWLPARRVSQVDPMVALRSDN